MSNGPDGKLEIICNDTKIGDFSSLATVKVEELFFTLRIVGSHLSSEIPPEVVMISQQLGTSDVEKILDLKKLEKNSWSFSYKPFVLTRNPYSKITMVVSHPNVSLRILSITAVREEAGYFVVTANNQTGFAVAFDFIGKFTDGETILHEGQRVPVVVQCKRYTSTGQEHGEAPDTPYLTIELRDGDPMPNLNISAVQLGEAVLVPFVHKGNGRYRADNFTLAKLPKGSYRLGVHLRADPYHYFGSADVCILSSEEYEEVQAEIRRLRNV